MEILSYINRLTLIVFTLSSIGLAQAGNKLACSYDTKSGDTGCFFDKMKTYDQLSDVSNGSMYCVPTAAAMALSALTFGGVSYYSSSWTANNFVNHSAEDRIENLADEFDTSTADGTSRSKTKKFRKWDKDFIDATENLDKASNTKLYDSHMRSLVRRGEVAIMAYGHYDENCTGTGSSVVCEYEMNGGHAVAVNGFYYTSGSSTYTTHIFDPWGGYETHENITKLSDKTTDTGWFGRDLDYRPYGGNTYYLYSSGNSYKIIDFVSGVNSN